MPWSTGKNVENEGSSDQFLFVCMFNRVYIFNWVQSLDSRCVSFCVFQSSLHCAPWDIDPSLEQQVAELKVNTELKSAESPADLEDSRLCSGKTINSASENVTAKRNQFF